jgi:hypothetical protein
LAPLLHLQLHLKTPYSNQLLSVCWQLSFLSNKPVASFVAFATPFEDSIFKSTPFCLLIIVISCSFPSRVNLWPGVHWISKSSPSTQCMTDETIDKMKIGPVLASLTGICYASS